MGYKNKNLKQKSLRRWSSLRGARGCTGVDGISGQHICDQVSTYFGEAAKNLVSLKQEWKEYVERINKEILPKQALKYRGSRRMWDADKMLLSQRWCGKVYNLYNRWEEEED